MGLPFAGYHRVSRVGDREDTLISPDLARERIGSYANARGLAVEMFEPELDVSGGKSERPILGQIIERVKRGELAGIIVADIDRLSRMNLVDALHVIEEIEGGGGQVIAVAQNFDAGTPEGRWSRNMWLATAHMQLERYALQFRAAKRSAVERGVWPTCTAPIGYTVTRRRDGGDGRLHPDPGTRGKVVAAFRARAAGRPWRAVAEILGVGQSAAGKVVRNRVYLGELRLRAKGGEEWVNAGAHEPLVDRELWEAAQRSHPRPPRRADHVPALLAGLARCAGCGGAMTPNSSAKHGGVERIYRCTPHNKANGRCGSPAIISQRKLDEYVEGLVLPHVDRLAATVSDRTDELERLAEELQAAEAERNLYHQVTRVGEIGGDAFIAGARAREEVVAEKRVAFSKLHRSTSGFTLQGSVRELYPGWSVEQRRHFLGGAIGAVWVRKGNGPCVDRVKVVEPGYAPAVAGGATRLDLQPVEWVDHLDGEVRAVGAQDLA